MKKLLYIANLRLPTEKAYGIQIAKMCEAFASQAEVELIYPNRKNTIQEDIFSYYSVKNIFRIKKLPAKDFYFPGQLDKIAVAIKNLISARALAKEALKVSADFYYTRDELVAYLLSKKKNNVIFECHRFSNKRKWFYSRFKKINLKMVAISDGLKQDLVKFGIKDSNILVARDGVDLEEFDIDINKVDARKKLFSEFHQEAFGRKKIAIYVGQLFPWKGVSIFSETAKYLCDENKNYLLFVFGGTDKKDPQILKKELERVESDHHPNFVPFFLGKYPHQDVPYILKAADCLILTGNESEIISKKYTSPLKMFEYMASGRPIVAQKLPSFEEVLNDQNSILVKPGDSKELANGISKIFKSLDDDNPKDPDLPERITKKAFSDVQEYTWQKRSEKILNFTE